MCVTVAPRLLSWPTPAAEWAETENKARAMLTAIGRVRAAARVAGGGA